MSNINDICYVVLSRVLMVAEVARFTVGGGELLLLTLSSIVSGHGSKSSMVYGGRRSD